VEPLAQYELGLYGSRDYLDRVGAPSSKHDLKRLEFVGYIDDMIYAPELRYLDEIEPSLRPSLSSSSIRAQKAIIEAGGGIGILPAFMAQGLTRILGRDLRLRRRFWMGVYKDSQGTVRMRAVSAWIRDLVQKNNGRLNPDA
jgi:DNA-binding transcriptional LysR family regulator